MATPKGGAIAMIRISGEASWEIIGKILKNKKTTLNQPQPNHISFGEIINGKSQVIDQVLVSYFKGPRSYTGEDMVEISCHGSDYIMQEILKLLIENGCRIANPGEYTQRAFLNGKLDLSQAEAVADLISAENKASHDIAINQLKGGVSNELGILRAQLLQMTSLLELELDFSDQDVDFADRSKLNDLLQEIKLKTDQLIRSFRTGQAIKKGIPVAIIGQTNVGKSTLLNTLLDEDKALVSDIHGTTRDVIEDRMEINGVAFQIIDTAGIRNTQDTIEQLGIERTFKKLKQAQIILWVTEHVPDMKEIKDMQNKCINKKLLIVINKIDQSEKCPEINETLNTDYILISAKYKQNIDKLKECIYQLAEIPELNLNQVIITNTRHYDSLVKARESIKNVQQAIINNMPTDLISEDLRITIDHLSEITGDEITTDEVLHNIFANFCIGK